VRSSGLLIGLGVTAAGEAAAVSQRGEGQFVGELGSDAGAAAEELVERGEESEEAGRLRCGQGDGGLAPSRAGS